MLKIKTITLTKLATQNGAYQVRKITDSLEFDPGAILAVRQVDELCKSARWKVTIVPDDR